MESQISSTAKDARQRKNRNTIGDSTDRCGHSQKAMFVSGIAALAAMLTGSAFSAVSLTVGDAGTHAVSYTDFTLGSNATANYTGTISSSQAGGSYGIGSQNAVASVASGSVTTPGFSLTITNNTGSILSSLTFEGSIIVFKDNSTNLNESLTASVTSGPAVNVSALTLRLGPFNDGNTASTVFAAPKTAAFDVDILGLNLGVGQSITIQWLDANDGGTDGMFGIKNLSLKWDVATVTTSNYWDANGAAAGVGGAGIWSVAGAMWNSQDGTGTPAAFDPAKELIFAGTAGTVELEEPISHESNIKFDVSGYTLEGASLVLSPATGSPVISVTNAGHIATIKSVIEGFSGLTKAGAGTLVLGGINTFAGDVTINAGILEIVSDDNLGATSNGIVLGGGTLKTTADVSLHEERATATGGHAISGAGGLDVADGATLTVNGTTSLTALTLSNSGTVDLQGATNDLGAVTVSGNATVKGNDASAANITASHAGTATIQNNLNLGAVDRTITVSNAAAVLALQGTLTGSRIIKAGAGTLEATGDNAGLSLGFQLGSTAATPTNGGTLKIGHKNGLGTTAQFRFNYGTLHAVTDLTGENALANSLSIGGRAGAAAAFGGSNMEINGTVGFFRGTSTTGQLELNTMNTTTLNGDRAADSGSGTATGITLGGTGTLILNGNWSTNTYAVTLAESVTTEVNNLFTGNVTVGDNNTSGGTTPTLQGRGTLTGAVTINSDGRLKIGSTGDTTARVMTVSGNLTSSGTMEFDLFSGSLGGEAGSSDKLAFGSGTTSVNLSGTLVINNADPDFGTTPWADGSFWQLIDWGTVQQANRTVNYSTITLPEISGYEWINTLATDGRITLSAVPEPGRMVLLLLGGGLLLIQRRRRQERPARV